MLGVLCAARPKPWILNSIAHFHHLHHLNPRCFSLQTHFHFADSPSPPSLRHHSTSCRLDGSSSSSSSSTAAGGGAASIWHLIQPCGSHKTIGRPTEPRGEGSWNVAWDARPARWLHRADSSAWLLFGVCACLAPIDFWTEPNTNLKTTNDDKIEDDGDSGSAGGFIAPAPAPAATASDVNNEGSPLSSSSSSSSPASSSADYKVTGVLADGRCLFRAIAHGACLRNEEEAPDENRQRELADELRAQVVDELLRRRKEVEWFIEDDFDAYVKRIQQPYVWGGEPELLMASHVLKTMISVFMVDRSSGNLVSIANYGEEYRKDEVNPINVLFHGYGHYDLLETSADKICQKVSL